MIGRKRGEGTYLGIVRNDLFFHFYVLFLYLKWQLYKRIRVDHLHYTDHKICLVGPYIKCYH